MVVNENPIEVTTSDQIEVVVVDEPTTTRDANITNTTPIPVTFANGASQKTVVSVFSQGGIGTIFTVLGEEQFILTDIIVTFGGDQGGFSLLEDSDKKVSMGFDINKNDTRTRSFHFNSGIPFGPGRNIIIDAGSGAYTISGYLIDL